MLSERITGNAAVARLEQFIGAFESSPPSAALPVVRRLPSGTTVLASRKLQQPPRPGTPGPHHTLTNPHVVTQHPALPLSGAPQSALPIAFGDDSCRLLAFQYEQAAPFNSVNDPRDQQAQRLPTARLAVSIRSFHAPEGMERSKQCLMRQLTESCRDGLHEKFFQ